MNAGLLARKDSLPSLFLHLVVYKQRQEPKTIYFDKKNCNIVILKDYIQLWCYCLKVVPYKWCHYYRRNTSSVWWADSAGMVVMRCHPYFVHKHPWHVHPCHPKTMGLYPCRSECLPQNNSSVRTKCLLSKKTGHLGHNSKSMWNEIWLRKF